MLYTCTPSALSTVHCITSIFPYLQIRLYFTMAGRRGAYVVPKRMSRSARAGLLFPVGQIHRNLRKRYSCQRVGKLVSLDRINVSHRIEMFPY